MSHLATRVPEKWRGRTVVIAGNGPSLRLADMETARAAGCKIVVINQGAALAPWADLLWFCDRQWFDWPGNAALVEGFAGIVATLENYELRGRRADLWCLHNMGRPGLFAENWGVCTGGNSGYQCINLAVHLGVKRILLLGFDMAPGHWFGDYPKPTQPGVYRDTMLPAFPALVAPLRKRGVEVLNCTPGSLLEVFPKRPLNEALGIDRVSHGHCRQPDPAAAALPA